VGVGRLYKWTTNVLNSRRRTVNGAEEQARFKSHVWLVDWKGWWFQIVNQLHRE
jgi:hypothetical protein